MTHEKEQYKNQNHEFENSSTEGAFAPHRLMSEVLEKQICWFSGFFFLCRSNSVLQKSLFLQIVLS